MGHVETGHTSTPGFAWSLFQEFGWGLVSHLTFWQAVPVVTQPRDLVLPARGPTIYAGAEQMLDVFTHHAECQSPAAEFRLCLCCKGPEIPLAAW